METQLKVAQDTISEKTAQLEKVSTVLNSNFSDNVADDNMNNSSAAIKTSNNQQLQYQHLPIENSFIFLGNPF